VTSNAEEVAAGCQLLVGGIPRPNLARGKSRENQPPGAQTARNTGDRAYGRSGEDTLYRNSSRELGSNWCRAEEWQL